MDKFDELLDKLIEHVKNVKVLAERLTALERRVEEVERTQECLKEKKQ